MHGALGRKPRPGSAWEQLFGAQVPVSHIRDGDFCAGELLQASALCSCSAEGHCDILCTTTDKAETIWNHDPNPQHNFGTVSGPLDRRSSTEMIKLQISLRAATLQGF